MPPALTHAVPACADSKALTHESRSKLLDKLKECKRIGYVTLSIPPEEISAKMMRK